MSASERKDAQTSEIPVSCEISTAPQTLAPELPPAFWLERVLVALSWARPEDGPRAVVEPFLDAAVMVLPDACVGLAVSLGPGRWLLACRPEGDCPPPPRLFPDLSHERALPLGTIPGASLHWAHENAEVLSPSGVESQFFNHMAVALATPLALSLAIERERTLRSALVQTEKLSTMGRLAAGMAHEINNPLTSIVAYTEFLRRKAERTPLEPDDIERLRRIGEAAERIRLLTRHITDYARPSAERFRPSSLHEAIEQALSFCEHLLDGSHIEVGLSFSERLGPIWAQPSELAQIFVNLITNACHSMPSGGKLTISTEIQGRNVVATVRDTGAGIAPEHLERIFEPFFTTKAPGAGTGLGLSIVRAIVEQHGGSISAESAHGQGSSFRVSLPVDPPG